MQKLPLSVLICFALAIAMVSYLVGAVAPRNTASFQLILDDNVPYKFVHPLLWLGVPDSFGQSEFATLRRKVEQAVAAEPKDTVIRYAYYFRDLNTSHWIGINENDKYDPGSLLKVVLAIAAYKDNEQKPGFFSKGLIYTQGLADINEQFPFAPPVSLKVGQVYQPLEIIRKMLSESDNAAKDLLFESLDDSILNNVYSDLSVPVPDSVDSAGYTISAKEYSRFFRVLYYGTYNISWADSNQILQYLHEASYQDGLVAGVPSDISVAHKFGEHVKGNNNIATSIELSDCGIVYHSKNPYFICVMTEGKDEATLARVIAKVSKITYEEADSNFSR